MFGSFAFNIDLNDDLFATFLYFYFFYTLSLFFLLQTNDSRIFSIDKAWLEVCIYEELRLRLCLFFVRIVFIYQQLAR
jgi:hypothetical protein